MIRHSLWVTLAGLASCPRAGDCTRKRTSGKNVEARFYDLNSKTGVVEIGCGDWFRPHHPGAPVNAANLNFVGGVTLWEPTTAVGRARHSVRAVVRCPRGSQRTASPT